MEKVNRLRLGRRFDGGLHDITPMKGPVVVDKGRDSLQGDDSRVS